MIGGFMGAGMKEAIRYGIARVLFSNESGLGSAPIVAAAAQTKNPIRQVLVSSTGTFWDTVVVCVMTGLMVGSVMSLPAVWSFADIANGLMAIPNLISLIALNAVIVAETRKYLWEGNLDAE